MDIETKELIKTSLTLLTQDYEELDTEHSCHKDVAKLENRILELFSLCKLLYNKATKEEEAECLDLTQLTIMLYHDVDDLRMSKSIIKVPINTSSIILN